MTYSYINDINTVKQCSDLSKKTVGGPGRQQVFLCGGTNGGGCGEGVSPPQRTRRSGGASFGPPAGPGAEPQPQTLLKVYSNELFLFQLTNDLCTSFTKLYFIFK